MNLDELSLVVHNIKGELYPSNLKDADGEYFALTKNERTLDDEDICTTLITRTGFAGKREDMLNIIRQYNRERMYHLCDGYAVTNGWYTARINIGGMFAGVNDPFDPEKNPVSFRFTPCARMRKIAKEIVVEIDGLADTNGCIYTFTDFDENAVNSVFIPGDQSAVVGSKIRLEGDDPGVGLFFVPVDNPSAAVKVMRIAENGGSKITFIAPQTGYQYNRIEIRTQFSGNLGKPNKALRVITSSFVLEEA